MCPWHVEPLTTTLSYARLYNPALHRQAPQAALPCREVEPVAQSLQMTLSLTCESSSKPAYFPAAQAVHAATPVDPAGEEEPGAHAVHGAVPGASLYLPGEHCTHALAGPVSPALHWQAVMPILPEDD